MDGYHEASEEDYYPDISKEKIEYERSQGNIFYGRDINWIGTKGSMVRVPTNNMYPIEENPFYLDKMMSLKEKIEYSEEKVFLYAPYVTISKVSPITIKEYLVNDPSMNLSTGDVSLDEYLKDEEEWIEENLNLYNFPDGLIEIYDSESILNLENRKDELESELELDEFDRRSLKK